MNSTIGDRGETPSPGMWPWYNMYQQNSYQPGYSLYGHQGYYPYYGHGHHQLPFNGQQSLPGAQMHPSAMKGFVSGGTLMPFAEPNSVNNSGEQLVLDAKNTKDEQSDSNKSDRSGDTDKRPDSCEMPPLPPGPPPPIMRFATPPPPPGTSPNNRFYQPNGVGPVKFSFGSKQQVRPGMSAFAGNNNQMNDNNNAHNSNGGNMFMVNGGGGGGGKKKRRRGKGNKSMNANLGGAVSCPPPLPPHVLLKMAPPLPPGPPPADNNPPLPPPLEDPLPSAMHSTQNGPVVRNDRMEVDEEKNVSLNCIGNNNLVKNNSLRNNFSPRNQINPMRMEEIPQALKNYMERCYGKCTTAMDRDRVDIILKGKIVRASADDTLWTKDWDNEPLPLLANELENVILKTGSPQQDNSPQRKQLKGLSAALESRLGGRRSFSHKSRSPVRNKGSPKRRRDRSFSESSSSSDDNYKSTKSSKSKMSKFNKNHSNSSSKSKSKQSKVKSHFYSENGFSEEPVNPEVLEKRAARFNNSSSKVEHKSLNSSFLDYHSPLVSMKRKKGLKLSFDSCNNSFQDSNGDIDFSDCHVVGTCQDIEKQYLRLTAAPEASAVRPPAILQQSLARIKEKWVQNQDYYYACEQLKSVRQDLTVQGIRDALTVKVYETHARIALEKGDHAEFNQCQSQLRSLYSEIKSGNRLEFTAYRILYYIFTKEFTDITNVVASLSEEDKRDECVDHALKVQSAWWLANYHKLFKLYKSAPRMSSYLIDWFLQRERKSALKSIVKSYRPNLAVEFVSQELAFDKEEECLDFLAQFGVVYVDSERTKIDCKASVVPVSSA